MFKETSIPYCPNLFILESKKKPDFTLPVYKTLNGFVEEYTKIAPEIHCTFFCPKLKKKEHVEEFHKEITNFVHNINAQFIATHHFFSEESFQFATKNSINYGVQDEKKNKIKSRTPILRICIVTCPKKLIQFIGSTSFRESLPNDGLMITDYTVSVPKHVLIPADSLRQIFDNLSHNPVAVYDPTYIFPLDKNLMELQNYQQLLTEISTSPNPLTVNCKNHVISFRNLKSYPDWLIPTACVNKEYEQYINSIFFKNYTPNCGKYEANGIDIWSYKFAKNTHTRNYFKDQNKTLKTIGKSSMIYFLKTMAAFFTFLIFVIVIMKDPVFYLKMASFFSMFNLLRYIGDGFSEKVVNFFNTGFAVFSSKTQKIHLIEKVYSNSSNLHLKSIIVSRGYLYMVYYVFGDMFLSPIMKTSILFLYFYHTSRISQMPNHPEHQQLNQSNQQSTGINAKRREIPL